jgi:hypothetical protein
MPRETAVSEPEVEDELLLRLLRLEPTWEMESAGETSDSPPSRRLE